MTQEEKQLLLQDLCSRLPYNVKCSVPTEEVPMTLTGKRLNYFCFHHPNWGVDYSHEREVVIDPLNDESNSYVIKPYLRPMSSMTEEEKKEFESLGWRVDELDGNVPWNHNAYNVFDGVDWLNKKMFDYRGLIEKGLAIAVTKENNPYEN